MFLQKPSPKNKKGSELLPKNKNPPQKVRRSIVDTIELAKTFLKAQSEGREVTLKDIIKYEKGKMRR